MEFSTISFAYYFIPIVMLIYFIVPFKLKNIVLLISSLFFYFWGESSYLLVMIASSILGYGFGLLIDKHRNNKKLSKLYMILSISCGNIETYVINFIKLFCTPTFPRYKSIV